MTFYALWFCILRIKLNLPNIKSYSFPFFTSKACLNSSLSLCFFIRVYFSYSRRTICIIRPKETHYYSIHVPCQKYDGIIKYLSLFESICLWYSIIVLAYVAFSWCEIRFWRFTSSFFFMLATDTFMWLRNKFLCNHNIKRY